MTTSTRRRGSAWLASALMCLTLMACQKPEGPAEKAGKEVDQALDQAGNKAETATEKLGEQVEKAGEKIQDAAKDDK